KNNSLRWDVRSPIFEKGGPTSKPDTPRSSTNAHSPPNPRLLLVVANTIKRSLSGALVTNVLEPLSTQPPSTGRAVVRSANASEPDPGSVIPCAAISEPLQSPGSQRPCCSSVPKWTIGSSQAHIWALIEKISPLS